MPPTIDGYRVDPAEPASWVLFQDDDLLVLDKPAGLVCHPSKDGPWSSLVGACRAAFGPAWTHLVSRLDRETSGVLLLAGNPETASRLQRAVQGGRLHKEYIAILRGELSAPTTCALPIGPHPDSPVVARRLAAARPEFRPASTRFVPLARRAGHTLARITPLQGGRQHQVRVHAEALGYPLLGDKIYGRPPEVFLAFIKEGWTDALARLLTLPRQALHCSRLWFDLPAGPRFRAPLPADLKAFWRSLPAGPGN
ncbi:MAG: RluA family pseudouridine synthase [Puniceicoccaceae bacterium]|nr:MAG: RluA family pseudouridine synthase [Puniceicoccaceae bacterium]